MLEIVLVLCALGVAPIAAISGAVQGRRASDRSARSAAIVVALGWGAAVCLAIQRIAAPSTNSSVKIGWLTLTVDWLALVMLMLVLGLSAVIQFFAVRYLRGDPRQAWFVLTANLLTTATVLMACASTVLGFGVAWLAAGASLVALLATYPQLPQARDGVRRTTVRFVLGDLPLVAGIALLMLSAGGDVAFADLGTTTVVLQTPLAAGIAVMLAIPALARSSQVPFHGWLPATLAAPTPVSALMHAGVVNAGAILVLRFSPTIAESTTAMIVLFCAGTVTLIYASAVRLTKPDVKGRLVFSTMAQMGFMMLACGMGAFAAAVFHLIAHGLFKATLFLGAGSGVAREARQRAWPTRHNPSQRQAFASITIAIAVPVAAILAARPLLDIELSPASQALQVFVIFTAALALGTVLWTHFSVTTVVLGTLGVIGLTFGYSSLISTFDRTLGFVSGTAAVNAGWLLVPATALVALHLTLRTTAVNSFSRRLYAGGLAAGIPLTSAKSRPPLQQIGVSS